MSESFMLAILSALCFTESTHKTDAINIHDGGTPSYGLCQIKYQTAKELGFKGHISDLWLKPEINKYWALQYLKKQLKRYGTVDKAIAAYNAGSLKNGEIRNTKYVRKVKLAFAEGR